MDKLKQWVALSVVASLLIVAAGWFLAVAPKRSEAAALRTQAAEQVAGNSALETQLQVLRAQAKDLPKEQAKLAAVSAKIPADPSLPGLVRLLIEAAEQSGVTLVSVSPSPPELVAVAAPAPVEAPAAGQTAPVDPAAPAAPGEVPSAPAGLAGQLANIPLNIDISGDYFEVQRFVAAVEELPRAFRVTQLAVVPDTSSTDENGSNVEDGSKLTSTITAVVFMAANRPPATAATVPGDAASPADATADAAATTATPAS